MTANTLSAAPELPAQRHRPDDALMTANHVREHFGSISEMTLWRWLRDSSMDFPEPIVICRRRYWKRSAILAFQERQASGRAA